MVLSFEEERDALQKTRTGIIVSLIGLILLLTYILGFAPGLVFVIGLALLLYGPVIIIWGWDKARKQRKPVS
jgi:uncharacterized protein (DUF58 family)